MTVAVAPDELDLRSYLAIARRRKWTLLFVTLVTLAVAVGLTFVQTPVYQASSEVLLDTDSPQQLFDPVTGQLSDPSRAIQNEVRFIESDLVAEKAEERLGYSGAVTVATQEDADTLQLTATSTSAQEAADVANTYAQVYLDERRQQSVADYQATAEAVQTNLAATEAEIGQVQGRLDLVRSGDPNRTPEDLAQEEAQLSARLTGLQEEQTSLQDTLRRLSLTGELVQEGSATIISEAVAPNGPFSPKPIRNALLGLVVGLILGVGLAFLREYLDDSIRTKEDHEAVSGGLPMLGLIPHVGAWRRTDDAYLVSRAEPSSPITEAYRSLRTSVQFLGVDRPLSSICVTSTRSGEGKTTTVANLAVVLADGGLRVLALDCDLRRPRLHAFFGLSNATGFTTAFLNDSLAGMIQPVEGNDNLSVMASGAIPPNPAEFLSSAGSARLYEVLASHFDVVIIDAPPVLPVADALILSRFVDATLIVSKSGVTSRRDITRAIELLAQVNAPVIGTVFNDVAVERGYGYTYSRYQSLPGKPNGRGGFSGPVPDPAARIPDSGGAARKH